MTDYVREHSVGDLLTNSIAIYRQHFRSFFVAYFVPALPLTLLQEELQRREHVGATLLIILINFIVVGIATGAMTVMVSDACLGRPVSAGRAYRSLLSGRVGKVMGTAILVTLLFIASVLLLVIPVFIVYPSMMLAIPATVLEGRRPGAAVRRSWDLSRGLRLRNLGVLLLMFLIVVAVIAVVSLPIGLVMGFAASGNDEAFERVLSITASIMQTLIIPVALVLQVLLYYDARVRHEGYDSAALSTDLHW